MESQVPIVAPARLGQSVQARGWRYPAGLNIMQVSKWGSGLAIPLPAVAVETFELREVNDIKIHSANQRVFEVKKNLGVRELLARLRKFRRRLPADFKFKRGDVNERRWTFVDSNVLL